jgi:hypothetical protein
VTFLYAKKGIKIYHKFGTIFNGMVITSQHVSDKGVIHAYVTRSA